MILANHGIVSSSGGFIPSTLLTDLYAVYKAESNSNDSLGVYNGTAQGGLTYSTGKSGNAFLFNGTNAYVSAPDDSYNSLTADFSLSMWVNVVSTGGIQGFFTNFAYDGSVFYGISISNNNGVNRGQIFNGTGSIITLQDVTPVSYGVWEHLVFTRKASTGSKIYRNGVLSNTDSSTINPVYSSGNMRPSIGAQSYGPLFSNTVQYYAGNGTKIDELNIWAKEVTATEVTDLYNSGAGKFYPTF
jgi:hypothetical protein